MSLREFVHQELVADGTLDEEEYSVDDLSKTVLFEQTDLGEEEIDDLIHQYEEYCDDEGIEPIYDLED